MRAGRWQPKTLRGRLSLAAVAVATLTIVGLTTVFNLLLIRRLHAQEANVLRVNAGAAASTVSVRADGSLAINEVRDTDLDSGIWVFEGSRAIETPTAPAAVQAEAAALAGTDRRFTRSDEPNSVALYSMAVLHHGRQVGTVVSAISLVAYERSTRLTVGASVVLAVSLLLVIFVLVWSLVGGALAPVAEMTRQARTWSQEGANERFGETARPGELAELAATLDDLLDRLSAVLRRERQLSAEISHELRTPLAGIVAETELFATRPRSAQEASQAMEAVGAGARRMEGILETLLSAARAEAGGTSGRSEARAALREAVEALGSAAVPVVVEGPDEVWLGADQAVVERAVAPLLANAVRHATSLVTVSVHPGSSQVRIEVRDDGPGVPAGLVEEVFEPGRQVDPEHGGAGLGLALARRLARAAGGDVVCRAGPPGRFELLLPPG